MCPFRSVTFWLGFALTPWVFFVGINVVSRLRLIPQTVLALWGSRAWYKALECGPRVRPSDDHEKCWKKHRVFWHSQETHSKNLEFLGHPFQKMTNVPRKITVWGLALGSFRFCKTHDRHVSTSENNNIFYLKSVFVKTKIKSYPEGKINSFLLIIFIFFKTKGNMSPEVTRFVSLVKILILRCGPQGPQARVYKPLGEWRLA